MTIADAIDWILSLDTPPMPVPSAWTDVMWCNHWREQRGEVLQLLAQFDEPPLLANSELIIEGLMRDIPRFSLNKSTPTWTQKNPNGAYTYVSVVRSLVAALVSRNSELEAVRPWADSVAMKVAFGLARSLATAENRIAILEAELKLFKQP